MSPDQWSTLLAAAAGAAVGGILTLLGTAIIAAGERRRRTRSTLQETQRTLWKLDTTLEIHRRSDIDYDYEGLERELERLLREVLLLVPDLPRRVRDVVESAVDVVRERDMIGYEASQVTVFATNKLLMDTLAASGPKAWLRGVRRAKPPPLMRRYVEELPRIEAAHLAEHEAELEQRRKAIERRGSPPDPFAEDEQAGDAG